MCNELSSTNEGSACLQRHRLQGHVRLKLGLYYSSTFNKLEMCCLTERQVVISARCADGERHVIYDDLLLAGVLRAQPIGLCRVEADGRELLERRR